MSKRSIVPCQISRASCQSIRPVRVSLPAVRSEVVSDAGEGQPGHYALRQHAVATRTSQRDLVTAMRPGWVKWHKVLSNTVLGRLQTAIGALIVCHSIIPAIIGFPSYTAGQLAAIFATLAREARFTLTPRPPKGRYDARTGKIRSQLRQCPTNRPAARTGHRQPGPLGRNPLPVPGSGQAEHDARGGHKRAHVSPPAARRRPIARQYL